ncbi:MAG: redoxin domain-containing protein [Desulfobacterales bacterium]|nr:MAG: redoxin domain-containing protein [Desulfobacterales bacterium]
MAVAKKKVLQQFVLILIGCSLAGCAGWGKPKPSASIPGYDPIPDIQLEFADWEFPVPQNPVQQKYLGLGDSLNFKITDIQTRVLIIEVFNIYCPVCHMEAPRVNELYDTIDRRTDLRGKVKMIGIGLHNTPFEINLYREHFGVRFPLLADENLRALRNLKVDATPTFIGLKLNRNGAHKLLYYNSGGFGDVEEFLERMLFRSGLGAPEHYMEVLDRL